MRGTRYIKVCLIAYLFLCSNLGASAQNNFISGALLPYYQSALNYDFQSWPLVDIDTLDSRDIPAGIYINNLAATLQTLIIQEDPAIEKREGWANVLEDCEDQDSICKFVLEEINLHKSIIHFLNGEHLKSFLQFRKVYRSSQNIEHSWSLKTSGTLNVMLGTVPDQYQWIINLLGYQGDQTLGMKELDQIVAENTILSQEISITKLMFDQYLFETNTINDWYELRVNNPHSPLIQFLFNAIALKNHQSEYVIQLQVDSRIEQVYGQLGEAYLNKLEYDSALIYFDIYEDALGDQMTAEMLHKIWLCHRLKSNNSKSTIYANKLIAKDKRLSEADENAIHNLQLSEQQDLDLMKVRLSTDGGYYQSASNILKGIDSTSLNGERTKAEYTYRKARLLHLRGFEHSAITHYQIVLDMSPKTGWYFAPNSAYQLGLIYESMKELGLATKSYLAVQNYKNYPYRNSLENKSKLRIRMIESKR